MKLCRPQCQSGGKKGGGDSSQSPPLSEKSTSEKIKNTKFLTKFSQAKNVFEKKIERSEKLKRKKEKENAKEIDTLMKNSPKIEKYTLKLKTPRSDNNEQQENLLHRKQGPHLPPPHSIHKPPQTKSPVPHSKTENQQASQSPPPQVTNLLLRNIASQISPTQSHLNPAPIRPTDQSSEHLLRYPSNSGSSHEQPGVKIRYVDTYLSTGTTLRNVDPPRGSGLKKPVTVSSLRQVPPPQPPKITEYKRPLTEDNPSRTTQYNKRSEYILRGKLAPQEKEKGKLCEILKNFERKKEEKVEEIQKGRLFGRQHVRNQEDNISGSRSRRQPVMTFDKESEENIFKNVVFEHVTSSEDVSLLRKTTNRRGPVEQNTGFVDTHGVQESLMAVQPHCTTQCNINAPNEKIIVVKQKQRLYQTFSPCKSLLLIDVEANCTDPMRSLKSGVYSGPSLYHTNEMQDQETSGTQRGVCSPEQFYMPDEKDVCDL